MKPVDERKKLKTELKDPKYAGLDHVSMRDKLREITDVVDDATERATWQLFECTDKQERDALNNPVNTIKLNAFNRLLSMGRFSPTAPGLIAEFVDIFGAQSKSVKALAKIGNRPASKMEFLRLGSVTESDVADALLRTED